MYYMVTSITEKLLVTELTSIENLRAYISLNKCQPNNNTGEGNNNTGEGNTNTGEGNNNTGEGNNNTGEGNNNTGDGNNNTGEGNNNTGEGDLFIEQYRKKCHYRGRMRSSSPVGR